MATRTNMTFYPDVKEVSSRWNWHNREENDLEKELSTTQSQIGQGMPFLPLSSLKQGRTRYFSNSFVIRCFLNMPVNSCCCASALRPKTIYLHLYLDLVGYLFYRVYIPNCTCIVPDQTKICSIIYYEYQSELTIVNWPKLSLKLELHRYVKYSINTYSKYIIEKVQFRQIRFL